MLSVNEGCLGWNGRRRHKESLAHSDWLISVLIFGIRSKIAVLCSFEADAVLRFLMAFIFNAPFFWYRHKGLESFSKNLLIPVLGFLCLKTAAKRFTLLQIVPN